MSRVRFLRRTTIALVAALVVASCGTGTESGGGRQGGSDGRNVAIAADNGLPFQGLSPNFRRAGVDPTSQRVWVMGDDVTSGLVTGGLALYQTPKFSTLDPAFPRIGGYVYDIDYAPATGEVVVAGQFRSVGTRGGMVNRDGLAIFGPEGLKSTDIDFNAPLTSVARIGNRIYLGGYFSYAEDRVSGLVRTDANMTVGFALVDAASGRLAEQQVRLPLAWEESALDLVPGRTVGASSRWLAVNSYSRRTNNNSLQIFDAFTGQLVKTIIASQANMKVADAGNGYALVTTGTAGSPNDPRVFRILDIEAQSLSAAIVPAGHTMAFGVAGEGRVRLASIAVGPKYWLHDVDPRTRAVVRSIELPSGNQFSRQNTGLAWAGDGLTLYENGVLFDHSSKQFVMVRQPGSGGRIHVARTVGNRGLLVGGIFDTAIENVRPDLISLPADGSLADIREPADGISTVTEMTSTPRGVVALSWTVARNLDALLLDPDPTRPAQVIARITGSNNCQWSMMDMESKGSSVFISGCWQSVSVAGTVTTERVVEIDISGDTPVLVRGYRVGSVEPDQIAITTNHVFATITENGGGHKLVSLSRATGLIVGQRDMNNVPDDMLGLRYLGTDVLLLGGRGIDFPALDTGTGTLLSMIVNDNNVALLEPRPVDGVAGAIRTMTLGASTADRPDPRYVFLAGSGLEFGATRGSVLQLDLEVGGVEPRMSLMTDSLVENVAVHGDTLWAVGHFTTVTSDLEVFRAPGVVAYDLANHRVFLRGTVPISTTTTVPVGSATGEEEAPITDPIGPTPPPVLPTNGEPAVGTYSFTTESGVQSEVRVSENGIISITPIGGNIATDRPFITRLTPGSRTVKVSWTTTPGKPVYKVVTGSGKSKRTCTTSKSSCTIKNLDPWRSHVFTVEAVRGKKRSQSDLSPRIKPFVKVRKGSSTKVSSIAPQGAKGKAKWTTTAPCSVKNGKLIAPKKTAKCTLKVVVGKSTRRVTVRVG